ncbi:fimbrial protein [Paraburkholderia madseniana]|jgi:type 1 fimbria pilin|uniref:fimbrial protein n=1 Tax=Paraburkholderia madseniana TaxID=2599607 RepID=UPI0015C5612D|nr:fimbrial protein [Paraburkholderia madseniana]NPT65845.1 hypothetical protein [Paraburkholderia madseniana]
MKSESGIISKLSRHLLMARRGRKSLGLLLTCLVLLLVGPKAHAECTRTEFLGDLPISLPATIAIDTNANVGDVLYTTTVAVTGATAGYKYATCTGSGTITWELYRGQPVKSDRIGQTSVAGIGYKASLTGGGFGDSITMDTQLSSANVPGGSATPTFTSQLYVKFDLVKTGPITPGKLSLNTSGGGVAGIAAMLYIGTAGQSLFNMAVTGNTSTVTAACTVTNPSPHVSLGTVSTKGLTGIGSATPATAFSLGLNCPVAGLKVSITLTDNANPTNTSNQLSLSSGSTASGVALQVLNAGTPVSFGPDSSAAGNTNQWSVGTSSEGRLNIPLTVRYVQTASSVKPGTANGVATFTMSYQ